MKYSNIIFDLDGTIFDTAEGIVGSFKKAREKFDMGNISEEQLKKSIGPPLAETVETWNIEEGKREDFLEYYRQIYNEKGVFEISPYDGIFDLIHKLKAHGFKLGVASAKAEVYIEKIFNLWHSNEIFDVYVGSTLDGTRTQKTDILSLALEKMGIISEEEKAKTLMVGDREYDLIGANNCGIDAAGVLYGFGEREELAKYPNIGLFETVSDLSDYLLKN